MNRFTLRFDRTAIRRRVIRILIFFIRLYSKKFCASPKATFETALRYILPLIVTAIRVWARLDQFQNSSFLLYKNLLE